jgi:orotidine-5'-phosphate decarboxylase
MARAITTRTFRDRLAEAVRANDSLLCVGLDPIPARFPAPLRHDPDIARAIIEFNAGVIAATADLACAYKPNLGFYLAHGSAGVAALEATRQLIPAEIPAILDAKVGDVGSTAEAYATAYFDTWNFDAVTVNPYLGEDALAPFMSRADRGVIVIAKTSNPGSGDLQDLPLSTSPNSDPVYLAVADRVAAWSTRWPATLGLVVGATYPEELAAVRRHCPDLPILLPGIGAQGGALEPSLRAGLDSDGAGLLVSASRSIIYASTKTQDDWTHPVRADALALRDAINSVRIHKSPLSRRAGRGGQGGEG